MFPSVASRALKLSMISRPVAMLDEVTTPWSVRVVDRDGQYVASAHKRKWPSVSREVIDVMGIQCPLIGRSAYLL